MTPRTNSILAAQVKWPGAPPDYKAHAESELIEACREFVEYYDLHGSHRLGNGQALRSYTKIAKLLGKLLNPEGQQNGGTQ